jgi:hypothetical protein
MRRVITMMAKGKNSFVIIYPNPPRRFASDGVDVVGGDGGGEGRNCVSFPPG